MFSSLNHVIIMVSNMEQSLEFYQNCLGLELKSRSANWSEFKLGSLLLALHGGGKSISTNEGNLPHSERAGTASISFDVEDLDKTYQSLLEKNVPFSLEPTLRQAESIKLAIARDPDGFEICFAQRV